MSVKTEVPNRDPACQSDAALLCLPFQLPFQDQVHVPVCDVALSERSNDFGPALAVSAIDDSCSHLRPRRAADMAQHDCLNSKHGVCTEDGWQVP